MLMPILQVNSEDIPEFVIVCGDPKRAETLFPARARVQPRVPHLRGNV